MSYWESLRTTPEPVVRFAATGAAIGFGLILLAYALEHGWFWPIGNCCRYVYHLFKR